MTDNDGILTSLNATLSRRVSSSVQLYDILNKQFYTHRTQKPRGLVTCLLRSLEVKFF